MFPVKIAIVNFIICLKDSTHPMETRFLLADNLYCKASVPPTDKVCLWLGVSKMELSLTVFQ